MHTHRTTAKPTLSLTTQLPEGQGPLSPLSLDRRQLSPRTPSPAQNTRPTDLFHHQRLDCQGPRAHMGCKEALKRGARAPSRPGMPKKEPSTRRVSQGHSRVCDFTGSGKALGPKISPSGSGNPSQPSEIHCWERLPPEALVSSRPWERQLTADLRVAKDGQGEGGCQAQKGSAGSQGHPARQLPVGGGALPSQHPEDWSP